jgi:hypothetical protein
VLEVSPEEKGRTLALMKRRNSAVMVNLFAQELWNMYLSTAMELVRVQA